MTENGRGLKVLVIGMGVLIVAGLAVLAVTIVQRAGNADFGVERSYATAALPIPTGTRAIGIVGGEDDVVSLLVEDAAGHQSVLTVDRRAGQVLGTLTLTPQP